MQVEDEQRPRARGSAPRVCAPQPRRWHIRLLCGHLQLTARFLPAAQPVGRLTTLWAVMLLVSGMLMALDAPRTLGLYLLLLGCVEGLVMTTWGFLLVLQWWRGWYRGRLQVRRAPPHGAWAERPAASTWASRQRGGRGRSEVDWRMFEAAWLCLLLMWWAVHP